MQIPTHMLNDFDYMEHAMSNDHDDLLKRLDELDYECQEEAAAAIRELELEKEALDEGWAKARKRIAELEAALEYERSDDDAEYEPGSPIFALAAEHDAYAERIRELEAFLKSQTGAAGKTMWDQFEAQSNPTS